MLNKIISKFKPKCLTKFLDKLRFFKANTLEKVKQYMFGLMNDFKRFNLETLSPWPPTRMNRLIASYAI